jgi:hypothetical protein
MYSAWLDYVLNMGGRFDLSWRNNGKYLFEIVESPSELEKKILEKAVKGDTARLVAGFCWPWSDPKNDGSLAEDMVIGTWSKPWNRKRSRNSYNPANVLTRYGQQNKKDLLRSGAYILLRVSSLNTPE